MIDFYFSPTPNGWKVGIMLEECGLDYNTTLVRLAKGDQFVPAFLSDGLQLAVDTFAEV